MTEGIPPVSPTPAEAAATPTVVYMPQAPRRSVLGAVFRYILNVVAVAIVLVSFLLNVILLQWAALAAIDDKLSERRVGGSTEAESKIAVVSISGTISGSRDGRFQPGNLSYVLRQLKQARQDDKVVGVVVEVNSPGGTITASDEIMNAVEKVRQSGKKVVVWMGSMATSGGYYVSCKADSIYAAPTTLTGSIGVVALFGNVEELAAKIGVKPIIIKSGVYKDIGSPFREMTDVEKQKMQNLIDDAFRRFKQLIADGRGLRMEEVDKLADGSIFTAKEALRLKLIDRIGYLEDAVAEAAGSHKDYAIVRYSRAGNLMGLLFGSAKTPRDVRLRLDTPLPELQPGLHYVWLPGVMSRD